MPQRSATLGAQGPSPAVFDTSAPPSSTGRLTPRSLGPETRVAEDDEIDDDEDQDDDEDKSPMTAAELRDQKRKMKRFRSVSLPYCIGGRHTNAYFDLL